jgi:hypothetical protein
MIPECPASSSLKISRGSPANTGGDNARQVLGRTLPPGLFIERLHMIRNTITAATAVGAALILSGCSIATPAPEPETTAETSPSASSAPAASDLPAAVSGCGLDGADGVDLTAAGTKLAIDTKGPKESTGAQMADVQCVLGALEVPDDVRSMMKLTTSTTEPTDAGWRDLGFAWNYSPEDHFRLVIVQA